jgi:PAS domain-containing protein
LTPEEYPAVRALRGDDFSDEILSFNNLMNIHKIVSVCGRPLMEDGEIIGALVTTLDITGQEERINNGKALLQKKMDVLDSIDDGLLSLDRAWRISYANRRIVKVLGLTGDLIDSKSIWEKYPKLIDSEIGNHLRQAMESNTSCRFEFNSELTNKRYLAMVYPAAFGISVYIIEIK